MRAYIILYRTTLPVFGHDLRAEKKEKNEKGETRIICRYLITTVGSTTSWVPEVAGISLAGWLDVMIASAEIILAGFSNRSSSLNKGSIAPWKRARGG